MRRRRGPLFLKRGSYRKRRLRDGARMLPVLGLFLFVMPVLWDEAGTAGDGLYLFAIWFGLVLVAALMAPGLAAEGGAEDDPADGAGEG